MVGESQDGASHSARPLKAEGPLKGPGHLADAADPDPAAGPPKPSRLAGSGQLGRAGHGGAPEYSEIFWTAPHRAAAVGLAAACAVAAGAAGAGGGYGTPIEPAAAAIRWLTTHSELSAANGDSLVLGASAAGQLATTLRAAAEGEPLPAAVLEALDRGWQECALASPARAAAMTAGGWP